jgi:hypothetical protein
VSHVYVHERGARKKVVCFGRYYGNTVVASLANMPRSGNASDSVSYNYDMLLVTQIDGIMQYLSLASGCLPTDLRGY